MPERDVTAMPIATRRLFDGYASEILASHSAFVAERLLEEGDTTDLRWLSSVLDEQQLATIFERCGARLSARSRAFWSLVLDCRPAEASEHALAMREATWTP
ncbi:MAG: hypothetical protein AAGE94_06520 [Acidobacteriota bacterium]